MQFIITFFISYFLFIFGIVFFNEVIESLQRGIEDRIKCENLILEVNSSK